MTHSISLNQAREMIRRYRSNKQQILQPAYEQSNILPYSETFAKEAIQPLLNTAGAAALSIYYGMDAGLQLHAILFAVDHNGDIILPADAEEETDLIVDKGIRCPPACKQNKLLDD